MASLTNLDERLFFLINKTMTYGFVDFFAVVILHKHLVFGLLVLIGGLCFLKGNPNTKKVLFVTALALVLADLAAYLLKGFFMRPRPCEVLSGIRVIVECANSFSFPSRQTTDTWAFALVLALSFRKYAPAFIALAVLTMWSRVYAGEHYPSDVLAGALLGASVALVALFLKRVFDAKKKSINEAGGILD
ncbi:MAG: phosphatase PAP2 family protein [Deltaproteobacteria bacterium]|nr:phosphatase PAP2 family protein [Deltaproteobacteria bacterium]